MLIFIIFGYHGRTIFTSRTREYNLQDVYRCKGYLRLFLRYNLIQINKLIALRVFSGSNSLARPLNKPVKQRMPSFNTHLDIKKTRILDLVPN